MTDPAIANYNLQEDSKKMKKNMQEYNSNNQSATSIISGYSNKDIILLILDKMHGIGIQEPEKISLNAIDLIFKEENFWKDQPKDKKNFLHKKALSKFIDENKDNLPESLKSEKIDPYKEYIKDKAQLFYCKDKSNVQAKTWIEVINSCITKLVKEKFIESEIKEIMSYSRIGTRDEWNRLSEDIKNSFIVEGIQKQKDLLTQQIEIQKTIKKQIEQRKPAEIFNDPELLLIIKKELAKRMVGENAIFNGLILFLIGLSVVLIFIPLSSQINGGSSGGKSHESTTVLNHFPQVKNFMDIGFGVVYVNDMTPAVIYGLTSEFIDRKIFYLGENPDKPSDTQLQVFQILRQLQTEHKINKGLMEQVEKSDNSNAKWISVYKNLEGYISFLSVGVHNVDDQWDNRQIPLSIDESKLQTEKIIDFQTENLFNPEDPSIQERKLPSEILLKITHTIPFKQFEQFDFENPYVKIIAKIIKKNFGNELQTRRSYPFLINFIEVITRLYWKQRKILEANTPTGKKIIATCEDNLIGLALLYFPIRQSINKISKDAIESFEDIKTFATNRLLLMDYETRKKDSGFTTNQCYENVFRPKHIGRSKTAEILKELSFNGQLVSTKIKNSWHYKLSSTDNFSSLLDGDDFKEFFIKMNTLNEPGLICHPNLEKMTIGEIYTQSFSNFTKLFHDHPIEKATKKGFDLYISTIVIPTKLGGNTNPSAMTTSTEELKDNRSSPKPGDKSNNSDNKIIKEDSSDLDKSVIPSQQIPTQNDLLAYLIRTYKNYPGLLTINIIHDRLPVDNYFKHKLPILTEYICNLTKENKLYEPKPDYYKIVGF